MTKRACTFGIGLLMVFLAGCHSRVSRPIEVDLRQHPGLEWLSWNPKERTAFVEGYIAGDGHGVNRACHVTDDLFETDKPHSFGRDNVPSTFPSSRCRARIEEYFVNYDEKGGDPDYTPFTNAITEFYTKYPDQRDTHFVLLMQFLAGLKHFSADDLYSRLQTSKPQDSSR